MLSRPSSGSSAIPKKLLSAVRRGQSDRLGELLDLYRNYLNLLADSQLDRKLRARVSPSDVVQEAMMAAHRDFTQFRGESEAELVGWLRQILVHKLARAIERHVLAGKRDVRREVSLRQLNSSVQRSTVRLSVILASAAESPSLAAERRERAVILADRMAELSVPHREVLVLRNLQGLQFDEVAARMDRTVAAAKMLWMRAIEQLRRVYMAHQPRSD